MPECSRMHAGAQCQRSCTVAPFGDAADGRLGDDPATEGWHLALSAAFAFAISTTSPNAEPPPVRRGEPGFADAAARRRSAALAARAVD